MGKPDRVIVVGGGLAGLTAAAIAARGGKRVTLLERASVLGGRAASPELAGATVNQGPHALYLGGAAARTLADLDVPFTAHAPPIASGRALKGGALLSLPTGAGRLVTSTLLGWRGRLEAAQVLAQLGPELAREGETLAAWLARKLRDPGARDLVAAFARLSTYANAPELLSARAALSQIARAQKTGVVYVDRGWAALAEGLRAAAERAGAQIVRGAAVDALAREGQAWEVRCGDEARVADDVVLAIGPAHTATLTGKAIDVTPIHAACLDLCLAALPNDVPRFILGIDQPLYWSVHSDVGRLGPGGAVVLHLAKYLHPGAPVDARRDEAELEALLDLAYPAWRRAVLARRLLPRMTVAHAIPTPAGRPDVDAAGHPGLHLAGDWIGPDGMLADAAVGSGARAARAILRHGAVRSKVESAGWHGTSRDA